MSTFKRINILVIFVLFCVGVSFAQRKSELESKKQKTLKEINYTNKLLEQTRESKKKSYNSLQLINKNIKSRKELINDINNEVKYVNERIEETELIISVMEEDLKMLKDNYAKMIRIAWKNTNKYNEIMFILSAKDFNQTYLRLKYMQQLASFRKKQFIAINSVKSVLETQIVRLNKAKDEKTALLEEEQKETRKLSKEQKQKEQALIDLKSQEKELKKKLLEQQKQMAKLKREIEKLIREDNRKSNGKNTGKYELTPQEKELSTNFVNNKGKLPWPVERGVITSRFGKQQHSVLKGITIDNKGIDISTTTGSNARAVFDGEVRKVFSIPGGQNAVIIRHGNYLTVYTHLEKVYVSVGDMVITKQKLGTIHTDNSENKTVLHFELWKVSTPINPSYWLAK